MLYLNIDTGIVSEEYTSFRIDGWIYMDCTTARSKYRNILVPYKDHGNILNFYWMCSIGIQSGAVGPTSEHIHMVYGITTGKLPTI